MADFAVSVLIPVYNVEKYIERCLRSVFGQTIAGKAEFILVNDCTPDNSMEIAKRVIADYPALKNRVRIIEHTVNRGGRQHGIRFCRRQKGNTFSL